MTPRKILYFALFAALILEQNIAPANALYHFVTSPLSVFTRSYWRPTNTSQQAVPISNVSNVLLQESLRRTQLPQVIPETNITEISSQNNVTAARDSWFKPNLLSVLYKIVFRRSTTTNQTETVLTDEKDSELSARHADDGILALTTESVLFEKTKPEEDSLVVETTPQTVLELETEEAVTGNKAPESVVESGTAFASIGDVHVDLKIEEPIPTTDPSRQIEPVENQEKSTENQMNHIILQTVTDEKIEPSPQPETNSETTANPIVPQSETVDENPANEIVSEPEKAIEKVETSEQPQPETVELQTEKSILPNPEPVESKTESPIISNTETAEVNVGTLVFQKPETGEFKIESPISSNQETVEVQTESSVVQKVPETKQIPADKDVPDAETERTTLSPSTSETDLSSKKDDDISKLPVEKTEPETFVIYDTEKTTEVVNPIVESFSTEKSVETVVQTGSLEEKPITTIVLDEKEPANVQEEKTLPVTEMTVSIPEPTVQVVQKPEEFTTELPKLQVEVVTSLYIPNIIEDQKVVSNLAESVQETTPQPLLVSTNETVEPTETSVTFETATGAPSQNYSSESSKALEPTTEISIVNVVTSITSEVNPEPVEHNPEEEKKPLENTVIDNPNPTENNVISPTALSIMQTARENKFLHQFNELYSRPDIFNDNQFVNPTFTFTSRSQKSSSFPDNHKPPEFQQSYKKEITNTDEPGYWYIFNQNIKKQAARK